MDEEPINNRLCFSGRTVPEISLINEDLPQKTHSYNGTNNRSFNGNGSANRSDARLENGFLNHVPFHSSSSPPPSFTPFVPSFYSNTSHQESPLNSKIDSLQLDLSTQCRKNDDLLKLVKDQQAMIRDLKQTVQSLERSVYEMRTHCATPDRTLLQTLQELARNVQGIPKKVEVRQIVQEIMKTETEALADVMKVGAKKTCDQEVQATPEVQDKEIHCQVAVQTTSRVPERTQSVQVEIFRNQRMQRNGPPREDVPAATDSRQEERRALPLPQMANGNARHRFADMNDVREGLPEIQGADQMGHYGNETPNGTNNARRPARRFTPSREVVNENYCVQSPNGGLQRMEAYPTAALPERGRHWHRDNEELDYYPERGSPGQAYGYELRGTDAPRGHPSQRQRNERAVLNVDRDNIFSHRGEESMIGNQLVSKYLGPERLSKLPPPPPPRPTPHGRRTIVTGNVSIAQYTVQTHYPSPNGNGPMRERHESPAYVAPEMVYTPAAEEYDEEYDSWDDEPIQGVPIPASERILDLTAIYNQKQPPK